MKKNYLFTLFALLLSQLFWAQTTESFELATVGTATFTSNSQVFNITSTSTDPYKIVNFSNLGWSGTAKDNRYIDNSAGPVGAGNGSSMTIKSAGATAFTVKSLYIYIATTATSGVLPSSFSATYVGKKAGLTVYTITKSSGYVNPSNTGVNNGFTLIDFATEGGTNNSNLSIDELVISATGTGDYMALDAFRWQLAPANTTPTDIALSATSINENVAANSTVGALTSTDANAGDTFTYSLVAGTGSTDNASFAISGSNLQIVSSPNFETKSSYAIRVRTTDSR
ncbi:MAG: large repetitive protein, partial [Bacteroidota bacterium]|nr:large repetitive protein [Bacteroidota bacterium]